jgi:hypothetical protein
VKGNKTFRFGAYDRLKITHYNWIMVQFCPTWSTKMLPNHLYEILPYLYISSGALAMSLLENYIAVLSGLILIIAGALVWILRSDHRRGDLQHNGAHHGVIPFWFYELQPFMYATGGLLLWQLSNNMYFYPSALVLIVVGLQIWLMRNSQRKHQVPLRNRASV